MADYQALLKRAEVGEAAAEFAIGNAWHVGLLGVKVDLVKAVYWYERAAHQGRVDAQVNLGVIHIRDLPLAGRPKDAATACAWFSLAANQGDTDAMRYLAGILLRGDGIAADPARAVELYEQAIVAGDSKARSELASAYQEGEGVPQDRARAAELYKQGADSGDATLQFNLAVCYLKGNGVNADAAEARRHFQLAAEAGHPTAQYNYGTQLMQSGSDQEGVTWILKAAAQGELVALHQAAVNYRTGRGVEQNFETALEYFRRAADREHRDSEYQLGLMFAEGLGMEAPRPDLAADWYQRALLQGHPDAAHNLGILWAKGTGVPEDLSHAFALFLCAVSFGNDDAMHSAALSGAQLGKLPEAAMWGLLAIARSPSASTEKLLGMLETDLGAEGFAAARQRAAEWKRDETPQVFHVQKRAPGRE